MPSPSVASSCLVLIVQGGLGLGPRARRVSSSGSAGLHQQRQHRLGKAGSQRLADPLGQSLRPGTQKSCLDTPASWLGSCLKLESRWCQGLALTLPPFCAVLALRERWLAQGARTARLAFTLLPCGVMGKAQKSSSFCWLRTTLPGTRR